MHLINSEYLYNYKVPGGVKLTLDWITELNGDILRQLRFCQRRKDFVLRTASSRNRL